MVEDRNCNTTYRYATCANSTMKITTVPVKRNTYSIFSKASIITEAYEIPRNVKPTARKFNVQPKQIRQWKKAGVIEEFEKYKARTNPRPNVEPAAVRANRIVDFILPEDSISVQMAICRRNTLKKRKRLSKAYRLEGGGRKQSLSRPLIRDLKNFLIEMREDEYPVDMELMICQAHILDPELMDTVTHDALRQRLYRCMKKWGFSYRRGTHKAQETKLDDGVMRKFHSYIKEKCKMLGILPNAVYNFDETNVYFSPHIDYSWDVAGAKTVGIKEKKSSQRCTAMLGSSMTGDKVTPYLIFTGANTRNGKIKQTLVDAVGNGYPGEIAYGVQANGWMDEILMLEWIEKVWLPISQQHDTSMIILDSFTAHLTAAVMLKFANCNTEVEIIPAGYTSKLQPMDVGINKPFKGKVRSCYSRWMVANKENPNPKFKPTRISVAKWIKEAWNGIEKNTFINSFYGSGFDIRRVATTGEGNTNEGNDNVDVLALII